MEKKLYFTPTVEKITVEASELLANSNCTKGNSKECSAAGESCGKGCQQAAKRCDSGAGESCGSGDNSLATLQSTYKDVEPATTNWSIWDEEL